MEKVKQFMIFAQENSLILGMFLIQLIINNIHYIEM